MSLKNRICIITPWISTIIFLAIGFTTGVWHPTWAVFFLILIVPLVLNNKLSRMVYPLIVSVIYVTLGLIFGIWHPLWLIFLTIPVYEFLFEPYLFKKENKTPEEEFKDELKKKFKRKFNDFIDAETDED